MRAHDGTKRLVVKGSLGERPCNSCDGGKILVWTRIGFYMAFCSDCGGEGYLPPHITIDRGRLGI